MNRFWWLRASCLRTALYEMKVSHPIGEAVMRWESVCSNPLATFFQRVAASENRGAHRTILAMNLGMGQLVAKTGIEERRFATESRMAVGASQAGKEALIRRCRCRGCRRGDLRGCLPGQPGTGNGL